VHLHSNLMLPTTLTISPPDGEGGFALADMAALPESSLIELLEGAIIVNPPRSVSHQRVVHRVARWLEDSLPSLVVIPGAGVMFDVHTGVIPDIVVFRPGEPGVDVDYNPAITVALVVEVLSPSTRRIDLGVKNDLYLEAVATYWVVDPDERSVRAVAGRGPACAELAGLDVTQLTDVLWS
jgi:Uma2 family endonuclease